MQKLIFTCPYEHFADLFREKNSSFLVLGWISLASYQVSFSGVLRTAFYVSKGTFWGKFFWKKPPLHDTEWKTFALLLNLVQRCYQNCILRVRRETLGWDSLIEKMCFLHLLRTLSQKVWAFWQKFDGAVLKTTSYVSLRTIWGFIFRKKNFHRFWTFSEINLPLPKKFPRGSSKLLSACPQEQFEEFFSEKCILSSFSDVVGELVELFWKSFGAVVKFCNFVSRETFRGKKIFFPEEWLFFETGSAWAKIFR